MTAIYISAPPNRVTLPIDVEPVTEPGPRLRLQYLRAVRQLPAIRDSYHQTQDAYFEFNDLIAIHDCLTGVAC